MDAIAGHELFSFMDTYSRYNQIRMFPKDEDKTAFTTDCGLYCYKVMPFSLKNAGATYLRMVNKVFANLIGKTMEVYVYNMLVMSLHKEDHVTEPQEMFTLLEKYDIKLNLAKCAFGSIIEE